MTDYTPTTEFVRSQYARHGLCEFYDKAAEDPTLSFNGYEVAAEFDRWLESVKAEARKEVLDRKWVTTPEELFQHVLAGRNAERERIEDIVDDEYADLVAAGHLNSEALVVLGRILDRIGGGE